MRPSAQRAAPAIPPQVEMRQPPGRVVPLAPLEGLAEQEDGHQVRPSRAVTAGW